MNILVLTSIYPHADGESKAGVTPVVHYFAKEWIKMGHNVYVVNSCNRYPRLLYILPEKFLNIISSKFDVIIPKRNQGNDLLSSKDGVNIARFPMLKPLPKKSYSNKQIDKQFKKITLYLLQNNFKPDIITGHWENPQIPLLSKLKRYYNCRTSLVFHGIVYINQKVNTRWIDKYITDIDVIGARSKTIAAQVENLLKTKTEPFICYSGIPDEYLDNKTERLASKNTKTGYLYVGRLIKRKNVDVVIKSLKDVYRSRDFTLNIIGLGDEKLNLERIIKELGLEEKVKLLGYLPREEVMEMMNNSEVFIMISNNETFGLVYLEAMSKGCIVIASKGGGVDGIIKNGYNGFLCEQGNEKELTKILEKINRLTVKEKQSISQKAIETAYYFKDSDVAQRYLNYVLNSKA